MQTVGNILKSEREKRKIAINDVSRGTRVSLQFLIAIENDDFDKLPGPTFVKGFLKVYARYLHLNEEEIILRFMDQTQEKKELEEKEKQKLNQQNNQPASATEDSSSFLTSLTPGKAGYSFHFILIFGIGLIALILLVTLFLSKSGDSDEYSDKKITIQKLGDGDKVEQAPAEIVHSAPTATVKAEPMAVQPEQTPTQAAPATDTDSISVLQIQVTEDTSFTLTLDGKVAKEGQVKKGDTFTWNVSQTADVELRDPSKVSITFNNNPIPQEQMGRAGTASSVSFINQ